MTLNYEPVLHEYTTMEYQGHCGHTNLMECFLQGWSLYSKGGLKQATLCLSNRHNQLVLMQCNGDDQAQKFELLPSNRKIYHKPTGQCLSGDSASGAGHLPTLVDCNTSPEASLIWQFVLPR